MKYDFDAVQDIYQPQPNPLVKGPGKLFCLTCKKTLDQKQFFKTGRVDKFSNGLLPHCKTCVTMGIDDSDPMTFLAILKEVDIPFIPSQWRQLAVKKEPNSPSIFGKYVSKMRLRPHNKYTWVDSKKLAEDEMDTLLEALRQESDSETEAEQKLDDMLSMKDIVSRPMQAMTQGTPSLALYGLTPETSQYGLTQEEINDLKIKWGNDYAEGEYLQMEQMFVDMTESYVIQDPIALSNAKGIVKMTIKLHKFLDIDDTDSVSKISRALDQMTKSSNLAPQQQKDRQSTTYAISQLAYLVEKEGGFIPEFYKDRVEDKIDMILQDMKEYTEYLVRGESALGDMLENTEEILRQDMLPEAVADYDDFALLEAELLAGLNDVEGGDEDAVAD